MLKSSLETPSKLFQNLKSKTFKCEFLKGYLGYQLQTKLAQVEDQGHE